IRDGGWVTTEARAPLIVVTEDLPVYAVAGTRGPPVLLGVIARTVKDRKLRVLHLARPLRIGPVAAVAAIGIGPHQGRFEKVILLDVRKDVQEDSAVGVVIGRKGVGIQADGRRQTLTHGVGAVDGRQGELLEIVGALDTS